MFSLWGRKSAFPRRDARRRIVYRPRIEGIEERCLLSTYLQTNLVSDQPGVAQFTDPNLINPWGLAASPTSPFWVSDNNSGLATLYNGDGSINSLVVTIPPPAGQDGPAAPTGIVFNNTSDFVVQGNGTSGTAAFIFATEDGTIAAWSPAVDLNNAILEVDNSAVGAGAVYKGLALGSNAQGNFLYATNFRFGTIDVFDANFQQTTLSGSFTDPRLPAGYAPFGIQNIGGLLYVTYAKQDDVMHDDVPGRGHGFVDVFDTDGNFQFRLASRGPLDSPWGLAVAPPSFGDFAGDLLIGNFGNGKINAFNLNTREFDGAVTDDSGQPIVIEGLWGLSVGNGTNSDANAVYFTAGPNMEQDGLFGTLTNAGTGPGRGSGDAGRLLARELGIIGEANVVLLQIDSVTDLTAMNRVVLQTGHGVFAGGSMSIATPASVGHAHVAATPIALDSLFAQDLGL